MWWDEFEVQLNFAFTAYARSEGRDIYSESMKLRILTKKVNADFLSHTKASIMTHMTSVPMNMTYVQALATFVKRSTKSIHLVLIVASGELMKHRVVVVLEALIVVAAVAVAVVVVVVEDQNDI